MKHFGSQIFGIFTLTRKFATYKFEAADYKYDNSIFNFNLKIPKIIFDLKIEGF